MKKPSTTAASVIGLVLHVLATATLQSQITPTLNSEPSKTPITAIVLTFLNLTGNPSNDRVGTGITETIATGLDDVQGLAVVQIDQPNVQTDLANEDPSRIAMAETLNAKWLISGAVQRREMQLRLTARVVDAVSNDTVQSFTIDGSLGDLFDLQDQLLSRIRSAIETELKKDTLTGLRNTMRQVPAEEQKLREAPQSDRIVDAPLPPVFPDTLSRDALGRATVRAVQLSEPLLVDGNLDEEIYQTVNSISGFIQQFPNEGEPATERTEAWIFFSDESVFVSARLWDSAPESRWIANEMQRDSRQLINNERFSVAFDTFYDRRNAVAFLVNPIGGFTDHEITDEGQPNLDWNPVWNSKTGRFIGGWTVEMEIPFKSLRFRPGTSQVWGLQLARRIRWKNESSYLTPIPMSAGPGLFRVSAGGTLMGLRIPSNNRRLEIKPYAIGSLSTELNAMPPVSDQVAGDVGVDVKYGITQNLTADFTYNTDFAQVEADEQQVNLTRFSLFFPEKREFFLEASGTFDFGQPAGGRSAGTGGGRGSGGFFGGGDVPTVFFSRRIGLERGQTVPILGGGRLTGKSGAFTLGALNIQTDNSPSAETMSTNFTVLRVKRDIFRRSRVGGIFTGRSVSTKGNGSNEVYGLDAAFSFYDNVNFNGYYAQSQTVGLVGEDTSYQAAFNYTGDLYRFQVDHLLVGKNFNPEIGFLRRDDFRRTFGQAQYRPRPSMNAVRQFTFGASLDYIETVAGTLETRIAQGRFDVEFENSDSFNFDVQKNFERLTVPFRIASEVTVPVGAYNFNDYFMSYALGQQRRVSGTISYQQGEFFSGRILAIGYRSTRVEVTPQLSLEPGLSINRIDLPQGQFTAKLITSRVTYTLTPRMFLGGLLQYNSSIDSLSANLRLRWEYQPGSELFVVYNDRRDTSLRTSPFLVNRAFVVKFTRLFRF